MSTLSYSLLFAMLCAILVGNELCAQQGTSSMSLNSARANANGQNGYDHQLTPSGYANHRRRAAPKLPVFDTLRIEEFINYHRHDLPMPEGESPVRLSVQQIVLENNRPVVQIGITTPKKRSSETIRPLNLVIVIDCSGSMASENRLGKVKKALHAMVERFRPADKITLVAFSNSAKVVLDACEKTKLGKITHAIESLHTMGSTNLYDGLKLGYQQAMQAYDNERTNRVLFLTDGNANIGVTDSHSITKMSKGFNEEGVSLSTIGVGSDFNQELLRTLSDVGKGLAHFVSDRDDIKKIFVNEFDSLLAPVATKVCLKIDFGGDADSAKIFGYRPVCDEDNQVSIELDNLNYGVTQVVMAQLPKRAKREGGKVNVKAKLCYRDDATKKEVMIAAKSKKSKRRQRDGLIRDYSIAILAKGIESASKLTANHQPQAAQRELAKAIRKSTACMGNRYDEAFERIEEIAQGYVVQLGQYCDHHFAGR